MYQSGRNRNYDDRRRRGGSRGIYNRPTKNQKPKNDKEVDINQLSVNERLQLKLQTGVTLEPRRYQTQLCEEALKRNVIIYLGTGLGKTFITVMYVNSAYLAEQIHLGRKAVFLAPTQDLIKQQAEYLNKHIPYKVKIFCGLTSRCGQHIDHWDKQAWDLELSRIDFLFMTPQIFSAAISTAMLRWDQFAVVIFDEVHHACSVKPLKPSKHPYAQILAHLTSYYTSRPDSVQPRIIGLTASLINCMPKDRESIRGQISRLEKSMTAKCVTDLEVQGRIPKMVLFSHTLFEYTESNDILTQMLMTAKEKLDNALKIQKLRLIHENDPLKMTNDLKIVKSYHNRLRLAAAGFSIKPGSFPDVISGLINVRKRCGLWMLRVICNMLLVALEKHTKSPLCVTEIALIYEDFVSMLQSMIELLNVQLGKSPNDGLFEETNAKPKALLGVLLNEYKRASDLSDRKSTFSCIVFVRSRLEVKAINEWLQVVSRVSPKYSFLRNDYAIGIAATMSSKYACITKRKPKDQHQMLESFRNGGLNVIVTTAVLEEGIDLPVCSTVVRYDQPNNFREYVQSRGRARQNESTFITLCELNKLPDAQDKLDKFNDFEQTLRETVTQYDIGPGLRRSEQVIEAPLQEEDNFTTADGSLRITSTTAKTILNMYCNQLQLRSPFNSRIQQDTVPVGSQGYQTTLYLPSSCPLPNGIKGAIRDEPDLAIDSAVVAAVKVLFEAGELDENAVPRRANGKNLVRLLAEADLEPKIEPLDKSQEGFLDGSNYCFEPRMHQLEDCLTRNFHSRTYKLIKLRFIPDPQKSRQETRHYFTPAILGLIVDSSMSNDFVPKLLYSHYGQFEVQTELISDKLTISSQQDHNQYLNYTFKLLNRCLSIKGFDKEALRQRCLFYIVRLTDDDKPDIGTMSKSFDGPNYRLRENDVVRVGVYYTRTSNNRRLADGSSNLMVVRRVHRNMTVNSLIPGLQVTFAEDARYQYGLNVLSRSDQPVLEVSPIANSFARLKESKQSRRETYRTNSLFYLEQFLDFFTDDPALVFQAFNLPEIVYRIYLQSCMKELDEKFLKDAAIERLSNNIIFGGDTAELITSDAAKQEDERPERDASVTIGPSGDNDEDEAADSGKSEDSGSDCEEDPNDLDVVESDYNTDYESDNDLMWPKYDEMIRGQALSQNDSNKDHMAKWDMREYKVTDLRKLIYECRHTPELSAPPLISGLDNQMDSRKRQFEDRTDRLVNQLIQFEIQMTSDFEFDQEAELGKILHKVDRSTKSQVVFDKYIPPPKRPSRQRSLLEALTTCRAQESYNLERLENIGDSFLKYVVSVVMFKKLEGNEGLLTDARSQLTNNEYFSYLAKRRRLGNYAVTSGFSKDHLAKALGAPTRDPKKQIYNRMRAKDLADTFESIVGSYLVYFGQREAILAIEWLGLDIFKGDVFSVFSESVVSFSGAPTAYVKTDDIDMIKYRRACEKKYHRFEGILSYKFNDLSYLIQAFNHASAPYKITSSYERLEFLGDAILDYLVTRTLVAARPDYNPGQITHSRSALVNNNAFAKLALKYKFDIFIAYSNYELFDELSKMRITHEDDPNVDLTEFEELDSVIKLLADVFESVAGAIYLDSNCSLDTVWSVFYPMMKETIENELEYPSKNVIAQLYELFPGRVAYEFYKVRTNNEEQLQGCTCKVVGFGEFEARGDTKRRARLRATIQALDKYTTNEKSKQNEQGNSGQGQILNRR